MKYYKIVYLNSITNFQKTKFFKKIIELSFLFC